MEHEHEIETHPPINKRIGILIGVMATILAFTEMAAHNADTDVLRESVEASDTWAFFQAKSIRAAMLRADVRALEAETSGQSQADATKVAATISEWNEAAAHEDFRAFHRRRPQGARRESAGYRKAPRRAQCRQGDLRIFERRAGAGHSARVLRDRDGPDPARISGRVLGVLGSVLGVLGSLAPHLVGG
jgi:hypothetical protein